MDGIENTQDYMQQDQQSYGQQAYDQQGYDQQYYGNQDWRANISPELQGLVNRFDSPESLVRAYREAQGLISKRTSEFSQQDWQSYAMMQQQLMGIPASYDGYNINTEPLSEDRFNTFTKEDTQALKEISHALGLTNDQAQGFYTVLNEMGNQLADENEQAVEEYVVTNINELDHDWGEACDTKLQAVSNCVENILPALTGISSDRIKQEVVASGIENSAMLMKIFAAIGELGSEGRSMGYNNLAPMDASMRLEHMKADRETASIMANRMHPMHNQVKREFRALLEMKNRY